MTSVPRSAVVTGAASGIGRAVAERLAADGWGVACLDRDEKGLSSLTDALTADGRQAVAVVGDVAEPEAHRRALDAAAGMAGVDAWIGVAGLADDELLTDLDERHARRLVDINQLGMLWGTAEALRRWRAEDRTGVVVLVSSVHARHAASNTAVYEMTKAALEALVRSVGVTYGPYGIRAVAVAPGGVLTPALERSFAAAADPVAARRHLESQTPANRLALPEEIAAAVAFVTSDEAKYISGTVLTVDGGMSAVLLRSANDPKAVRPLGAKK
jgi:NAD(P)-dependent dehydrogenase (short-subunit alcohol dehydrogenase family)